MAASDNQYFSLKDKRNKAAVDIGCKVWHDSSWLFVSDAISFCIAVDSLFSVLEPGHGTRDSSWEWSWRDKVSLELVSLDESANGDSLTRFCQFGCFLEAWDLIKRRVRWSELESMSASLKVQSSAPQMSAVLLEVLCCIERSTKHK